MSRISHCTHRVSAQAKTSENIERLFKETSDEPVPGTNEHAAWMEKMERLYAALEKQGFEPGIGRA